MAVQLNRRRFTVTEFMQLTERGILSEDDRVELIDGEIIEMAAIGKRHMSCVNDTNLLLIERLGRTAIVSVQNPIVLTEHYSPEPDIAVLRPRTDRYRESYPTPEDVLLLIEVSESTLQYDRKVKLPQYARAGIPEVWIIDLDSRRVERYAEPSDDGYRIIKRLRRGQTVTSTILPALSLPVGDIIGE
jgi:Uma2 family endonuclease